MKKSLLILFLFIVYGNLHAQIIDIPDPEFKKYLLRKFDTNNNGKIEQEEALKVQEVLVFGWRDNLEVLKYFPNLTGLEIDGISFDTWSTLDLTHLKKLKSLSLASILFLGNINVEGLTELESIRIFGYQYPMFVSPGILDLSDLRKLRSLSIMGTGIRAIKFLNNDSFESLRISNNPPIENLDLSNCPNLKDIYIYKLVGLRNLNLSKNTKLENFSASYVKNLNTLDLSNNKELTYLGLEKFEALTSLDLSGNPKLKELNCNDNKRLTNIDISKNLDLIGLTCTSSALTTLDLSKNINLKDLDISGMGLTTLDLSKNINLISLSCKVNQLTTLEISKNVNLEWLVCWGNPLSSLDVSKNINLTGVFCGYSLLTTLDLSKNTKLQHLGIEETPYLEYVNLKGTKIVGVREEEALNYYLYYDEPSMKYVCMNESAVKVYSTWFPDAVVNSYCDSDFPDTFFGLKGKNKLIENGETCETTVSTYPDLKFNILNGKEFKGSFISNNTGDYKVYLPSGTHTIVPDLDSRYYTSSPTSITIDTKNITNIKGDTLQDFCITPIGTHKDISVSVIPGIARSGFDTEYQIVYVNKGNVPLSGNIKLTYPSEFINFKASTQTPEEKANTLVWNYTMLKPFERREIRVTFKVSPPPVVDINTILTLTTQATPLEDDGDKEDNTFIINQNVVGSFDPNDKTSLQGDQITPEMLGTYMHYMIRFENTGTYYAENIKVIDSIDTSKFDISTIEIVETSHPLVTKVKNNVAEFIFDNIKLPHTDPDSHGYIVFKIKTLPSLKIGDELKNKADIYFDYNPAIRTNEAKTVVKKEEHNSFHPVDPTKANPIIYPNPAKDILYINPDNKAEKADIMDASGRLVLSGTVKENQINISKLKAGIYFITLHPESGKKITTKFSKY